MLTVDDVAVLINRPLDASTLESVVGIQGRELPSDHDEGHPEDEVHYYIFPPLGLEFLAGPDRIIATVICMLQNDEHVDGYDWSLKNGIHRGSSPSELHIVFGVPERTGAKRLKGLLGPTGPWERFRVPDLGVIHFQYDLEGKRIVMITVMHPDRAP